MYSNKGATTSRSSTTASAAIADLEVVQLRLQLLDGAVGRLEVLVETVALGDELSWKFDQRR